MILWRETREDSDESIFVATFQGAFMLCVGCLFTAFKMDESAI